MPTVSGRTKKGTIMNTKPGTQEPSNSRRSFIARSFAALVALALSRCPVLAQVNAKKWNQDMELAVDFEIEAPTSGRYKSPYAAVWIENAAGASVRTLSLWVATGKGSRWIPDLRRWYRDEQERQSKDGGDLISTVSSPTRMPGQYSLVWDGRNDKKALVDQGEYYICVEVVREHGPYGLVREKFNFANSAFSKKLSGDGEIKEVSLEYRKRK